MNGLKRLLEELHRRSLWQVLGVYLAAGWIALQVVGSLTESAGLPTWFPTFALGLLVLGLPVVLATAFLQRGLPASAEDLTGAPSEQATTSNVHRLFTWRNALLGGVAAFAFWGVVAAAFALTGRTGRRAGNADAEKSVAALPFNNLSDDQQDRYFADGVHDEILTQLFKIGALKVISRTSVQEYRDTKKNLKTIAGELGVRYILEGSVQRFGETVRITAQLIDAETDAHVWAETYDRPRADLLAIQSDVAQKIATALRAELTQQEKSLIDAKPTTSTEAYDFYLRGRDYIRIGETAVVAEQERNWRLAGQMFEKAIEADTQFARAHARLADVHVRLVWWNYDDSESRRQLAKQAIDRAVQLAPRDPEVQLALGLYHYRGSRNYVPALVALQNAQGALPHDAEVLRLRAAILRRQGEYEEAIKLWQQAVAADPRNPNSELANTLLTMRRFAEAVRAADRAIAIAPDFARAYQLKAAALVRSNGDGAAALRVIQQAAAPAEGLRLLRFELLLLTRDFDAALRELSSWPDGVLREQDNVFTRALFEGRVHLLRGDRGRARAAYQTALSALSGLPSDRNAHIALAEAHAGSGNRAEALRHGRAAVDLLPVSRDAWVGPQALQTMAEVQTMVGDFDAAIDQIEMLLRSQYISPLTVSLLRIDPRWDPLRKHPRFQRLLQSP